MDEEPKKKSRSNLPEHCLWQMKDPKIQAKAQATRAANLEKKRRQREVLESGFGRSKISDPNVQAELLDQLTDKALAGEEWAMKMLINQGAFKMDIEKAPSGDSITKDELPVEESLAILKAASKKEE